MKAFLFLMSILTLFLGVATISHADLLIMKNGDRITGEIQQIWDNEVVIEPEYDDSTTVTVSLALVDFIESERTFTLNLADGREVEALLSGRGTDGKQIVEIGEQVTTMALNYIYELDEIDTYYSWKSNFNISAAINRGNTDSSNIKFFADTNLKLGDHRHLASLTVDREEQDRIRAKEQDLLLYNYNWLYADQWFVGVSTSFEQDPIKNLDHRFILGVTLGRDFWNLPKLFLNAQAGVGYLSEKDTTGSINENMVAIWALRYRQNIFSRDFELYHDNSATFYINGRKNVVVKTLTGIRYKITDLFYLTTSVSYDYEENPPDGAVNKDIAFLFGFGLEI